MKYQFVYFKVRIFKCSYRVNILTVYIYILLGVTVRVSGEDVSLNANF